MLTYCLFCIIIYLLYLILYPVFLYHLKHSYMYIYCNLGTKYDYRKSMTDQAGIVYVRGCEVEGMLDASGRVIEEGPEPKPELEGDTRTFRLLLDPNQYRHDLDRVSKGTEVRFIYPLCFLAFNAIHPLFKYP